MNLFKKNQFEKVVARINWTFYLFASWLVLAIISFFRFHAYKIDDMFITLRYARNLVNGLGLVYNAGERVYSFTSVFHVFFSALLFLLKIPTLLVPEVNIFLGCLAYWGIAIIVFLFFKRKGKNPGRNSFWVFISIQ